MVKHLHKVDFYQDYITNNQNNFKEMRKQQNFTQPEITATSYAGEFAGKYISAALLSAKTLDNGNVNIIPNVKYKEVIQRIEADSIVNDASCDFTTSGSVSVTERVLEPKELQVNLELCKSNFVNSWEALQLGYSAFDEIPASFTDYLISHVGGKVAEATEQSIWAGTSATNGEFAGFIPAVSASAAAAGASDSVQSAQSGSITSANVLTKLQGIVDAIPTAVYGKEDLSIWVPTNVVKAYQTALGGEGTINGYLNQVTVGEKPLDFQGIPLLHSPGMTDSYMIAGQKSNFHFGTGLLSDYNEVRILDMAELDGSQNFRVIMRYTAGTIVGVLKDVAIHIPS